MWTRFMDMHSGGTRKLKWSYVYIEAAIDEACIVFQERFGINPYNVTCECCGSDYYVQEDSDLAQSTAYERGCKFSRESRKYIEEPDRFGYQTLDEYKKNPDILVIYKDDIDKLTRSKQ